MAIVDCITLLHISASTHFSACEISHPAFTSKPQSAYEAVNEDLKILSQKIERVKKCCEDSDKLIGTVQHETRNEIENIKKGMENKINKEDMEKAQNQHTEMLADETYASKIKRSSAIAKGPRDALCQLKSCQLPRNSAETTYTTSPDQIDGMKLEI